MPKPHHAAPPPPPPPLTILPPRHCSLATALLALLSVLLATALWLLLVLSPSQAPAVHSALSDAAADAFAASDASSALSLGHIVFGIAGSAHLWPRRREYIRLWWDPASMRGHVWLDAGAPAAPGPSAAGEGSLPPIRVSEDTSRFRYTNPTGHPSGLRIARIAAEAVRLVGGCGARWVVLVDDDTVVSAENLVAVLGKYDWREMVYVGASSESHSANTYFSHSMAFGGGGVALSFPLATALAQTLDVCIERYPRLYGSDDRLHACITELGVPLSREYGFHQDVWKDGNITSGSYVRSSLRDDLKNKVFCFRSPPLPDIDQIQVSASPLSKRWHLAPRRLCSSPKGSINESQRCIFYVQMIPGGCSYHPAFFESSVVGALFLP
ncbi:hypothetical protein GUJ93_ZPchr0010g10650 [Zizania palustris]|uniref:Uncharacterized protein n=1 Tax=Zizania palustris TaxID=103762 RepID=A0A8J5TH01_ZIZPA|nr:hypothetical protein GUJ93_ZPchr0010g10650 [Zizania palustris]